jgi:alpha-N-arabinofuranosidase
MEANRLTRRDLLGGALGLGAGALAARFSNRAAATATVLLDEPIGVIRPALYGQFTEHIGGVIYDGIWVGPDSSIPNVDGIRAQLVERVRQLGKVVIRWPGGCFADRYHWRDGIGPRARRPRRFGRWREVTEPNHFGTHEFLRFCELCGADPYLAGNVGTGSPEEFQQWVEYCNAPAGSTTLADERADNGHPEPFRVRYWGVGNESWGCGGKFTPEDYCGEYRRFVEWLPEYGVKPYLIAAGPDGNKVDWTRRFLAKWRDGQTARLDGWAPHYYCGTTGHALEFSVPQWYEMLAKADRINGLIADQWAALGEFDPEHKIKLIIDEWGTWHPEGTGINPRHLFEQMGTLRDALVAALTLDAFNRNADKIDMANIAQLVNNLQSLFLADEDRFVATPNFEVFALYRPHHDATSVRLDVNAEPIDFPLGEGRGRLFRVAGSASRRDAKSLTLTIAHAHADEPIDLAITLRGAPARTARRTVLTHQRLNAHNTFEEPEVVVARTAPPPAVEGRQIRVTLEPASVSRIDVELG